MVNPILCYGCEVWGFHKAPDIKRVHVKVLKSLLKVRRQTSNATVYGEFCIFPMEVGRKKIRIVKFWYKILNNPNTFMCKLMLIKDDNNVYVDDWFLNVRRLLNDVVFSYLWNNTGFNVTKHNINAITQRIYDQFVQEWFSELSNSNKLDTYLLIKEFFLVKNTFINNKIIWMHWQDFDVLRINFLARKVDTEIFLEMKLCKLCNMKTVENKYRFLLVCPCRKLRNECLPNY